MVRIPRFEPQVTPAMEDQPMPSQDVGHVGKAMQQLGSGLGTLGAGINAWEKKADAEAEKENSYLDQIDLLDRKRYADIRYNDFKRAKESDPEYDYRNFANDARAHVGEAWNGFSENSRSKAYRGAKGAFTIASLDDSQRYYTDERAGKDRHLSDKVGKTIDGRWLDFRVGINVNPEIADSTLVDQTDQSPSNATSPTFRQPISKEIYQERFERELNEQDIILRGAPPQNRRALEINAAKQAKAELATRGVMELPAATEMMERWSTGTPRQSDPVRGGVGPGASIQPAGGGHSIVSAGSGAAVRVSSQYADRFAGLMTDLEDAGVKINGNETGGYANRNIAGTNTKSRHAHGEAVDINWNQNPRGGPGQISNQISPEAIRAIAAKNGLRWGGDWRNPDPMHFEVDRNANYQPTSVAKAGGISANGVAFIKNEEGWRPRAYDDGAQTSIGWGTVGKPGEKINEAEGERRLQAELTKAQGAIDRHVTAPLSGSQRDALTSYVFNAGPNGAARKVFAALNEGNAAKAAEIMKADDKGGIVANRRGREVKMLLGGPSDPVPGMQPTATELTPEAAKLLAAIETKMAESAQGAGSPVPVAQRGITAGMRPNNTIQGEQQPTASGNNTIPPPGTRTAQIQPGGGENRIPQAQAQPQERDAIDGGELMPSTGTTPDVGRGTYGIRGPLSEMILQDGPAMQARYVKALEAQAARERFDGFMDGSVPFNHYDDEDKKIVDKTFEAAKIGRQIFEGNPQAVGWTVAAAQKLNYIPKDVAQGFRGLVNAKEPVKRVLGYEAIQSILQRNPNGFEENEDAKKLKTDAQDYAALRQSGVTVEESLLRIDEMKSPEWQKRTDAHKKTAEVNLKTFTVADIGKWFDTNYLPFTDPSVVDGQMALIKYQDTYKYHFTRSGDDAVAKFHAKAAIERVWNVSNIRGTKEVMQYPPERSYPQVWNPETKAYDHGYLARDIEMAVRQRSAGEKIAIGSIQLRADSRTAADVTNERLPRYHLTYKTSEGKEVYVPGMWGLTPADVKDAQAAGEAKANEFRRQTIEYNSKSAIEKLTAPLPGDPPKTTREPTKEQKWVRERFLEPDPSKTAPLPSGGGMRNKDDIIRNRNMLKGE